jgi:hypothetical protein
MDRIKTGIVLWLARRLPPCDDICQRLSDSLELKPPLRERMINRLHLAICVWCTRYREQIALVDEVMGGLLEQAALDLSAVRYRLSEDARERIIHALEEAST